MRLDAIASTIDRAGELDKALEKIKAFLRSASSLDKLILVRELQEAVGNAEGYIDESNTARNCNRE